MLSPMRNLLAGDQTPAFDIFSVVSLKELDNFVGVWFSEDHECPACFPREFLAK